MVHLKKKHLNNCYCTLNYYVCKDQFGYVDIFGSLDHVDNFGLDYTLQLP